MIGGYGGIKSKGWKNVDKKYHKRKTKISEYRVWKGKRKISYCEINNDGLPIITYLWALS